MFVIPSVFTVVDKLTAPVRGMAKEISSFAAKAGKAMKGIAEKSEKVARKALVVGLAFAAPLVAAGKAAISFEDKLADVAKTTGLAGKPLQDYGDQILAIGSTTRTSIDDLLKIGEIGGQLGIASNELVAFTKASNQFAVALGGDYAGGVEEAITQVGKVKNLFKETRDIPIADVITKTGSAINELGAAGAGTSGNINDFMLRIGALPDALKPSVTNAAALGTFFEEVGLDSQIASGGLTRFLLVAGTNLKEFAKQMRAPTAAAALLLKQDPTEFAKRFAKSLNGLSPQDLAKKLSDLGIGTQESIKVLGALGSGTERLAFLQDVANKSYTDGTSIVGEYNKKNSTTEAQLKQAQNNFQALAITIGNELLPVISALLKEVLPFVRSIMEWVKANPELVKTILKVVGAIAAIAFVVSGVGFAISTVSTALLGILTAIELIFSPVGVVIAAIALVVIVLYQVIKNFEKWGAAVSILLGPLGLIIGLFHSFYRNWEMIKRAFRTEGILGGLKAIGKTILDVILLPLQQILELASHLPGQMGKWAKQGADSVADFRNYLGTGTNKVQGNGVVVPAGQGFLPALSPRQMQMQSTQNNSNTSTTQNVQIGIKDETGRASVRQNTGGVPLVLTKTAGW